MMDFLREGVRPACYTTCPTYDFRSCETAVAQAQRAADLPPAEVTRPEITAEIALSGTGVPPAMLGELRKTLLASVASATERAHQATLLASRAEHQQRQTRLRQAEKAAGRLLAAYQSGMEEGTITLFGAWSVNDPDEPYAAIREKCKTMRFCCQDPDITTDFAALNPGPKGTKRQADTFPSDRRRVKRRYTRLSDGTVTVDHNP